MSFTSEKRERIKRYILEKIDEGQTDMAIFFYGNDE